MKKIYNKLVRDNIPQIIISQGKYPKIRVLADNSFEKYLKVNHPIAKARGLAISPD
ncbi:MAG: hypothetical protein LBU32_23145 [Clostridiales bacterium]|jgi:predicted house-cleaning noncanonical NTP pyrophosphatase (MazG superfamily)|nr:hypothetical protein [Clostridiales bacterium]